MTESLQTKMQATENIAAQSCDSHQIESAQSNKMPVKIISDIRELYSVRDLIWAWSYRGVRVRYKQSVLGGLWAVLQPAATVAVFSIIFTMFVPVDTQGVPYIIFSYVAMVPWTLFTSSVTGMVDSLVGNMNLVSKIYFPREVLPLSVLLARLFDIVIASGLVALLMLYFRIPVFWGWLFLPIILLSQLTLALGLGLVGSALNVFYRDVTPIFALGLQIWLYASPIIYPVTVIPEWLRPIYFLNPMAGILEAYRAVLLYQQLPSSYLGLSIVMSTIILLFGYWFFKRVEFQFADVV
jgi:lipopolysaccharide transport system permease protein